MRQETFRIILTMLKLRRYSSTPPPLFFKFGRLPPCNTITSLPNYNMDYSFRQLIFKFSSFYFLSEIIPYWVPHKSSAIWIFRVLQLGAVRVLLGCYELKLSRFILNATNMKNPRIRSVSDYFPFSLWWSATPTTIFQQKRAYIVSKNATIQKNCGVLSVFIYCFAIFNSIRTCLP